MQLALFENPDCVQDKATRTDIYNKYFLSNVFIDLFKSDSHTQIHTSTKCSVKLPKLNIRIFTGEVTD